MPMGWHSAKFQTCALTAFAVLAVPNSGEATEDGATLFKKNCMTCHTVEKGGAKRQGPNLWRVIGRELGSVSGFPYSGGLKNDKRVWTASLMDQWLENPKSVFRDTYMIFRQRDAAKRKSIITFLESKAKE